VTRERDEGRCARGASVQEGEEQHGLDERRQHELHLWARLWGDEGPVQDGPSQSGRDEREVPSGGPHVREGGSARVADRSEEEQAHRQDRDGEGEGSEIIDRAQRAKEGEEAGEEDAVGRVPRLVGDRVGEPEGGETRRHQRRPEHPLRDRIAAKQRHEQQHDERKAGGEEEEDARTRHLLRAHDLVRRTRGLRGAATELPRIAAKIRRRGDGRRRERGWRGARRRPPGRSLARLWRRRGRRRILDHVPSVLLRD
jgi:hypothetical protein